MVSSTLRKAAGMPNRTNNLVGKGGVGLVMFYLARQGLEFSVTTDRSDRGDIWIDGPDGILKGEVKTTTKNAWPVRISQISSMDVYFFVHLLRGECWVLKAEDVLALIRPRGRLSLTVPLTMSQIRKYPEGDVSPLRLAPLRQRLRIQPAEIPQSDPRQEAVYRAVRRTLATGEVREYRYAKRRMATDQLSVFSVRYPIPTDTAI